MTGQHWDFINIAKVVFVSAFAIIALAAAAILPLIMIQKIWANRFQVRGKTVLITGASEGMGRGVARVLAKKGANIIIVSRNVAKLEDALADVHSQRVMNSQRFHYIAADLTEDGSATRVISEATSWNNGQAPDIVWCVAGSSYPKLFIETPISKMREQMDVNYWSCATMAHAILTEWLNPESNLKGKEKHLIFTSSLVAFYTVTGYGPYSPAKAAIKSLSDTLVQEVLLYQEDVKVHTVFPGGISSPGFENENLTKPAVTHILEEPDTGSIQTPDEAAKRAVQGLENGDYLITLNFFGQLMRAAAWGGSARNNWITDTLLSWALTAAWPLIGRDIDGKVKKYAKKHGHPSTYPKKD
ncbi:3-ketodihydrosphingosine reductase-like protein tsc10 [Bisporella sp. PMI_857]|nr:3-ketodihydrosphingosine reductase-like protein tsc10 [Bisporella sp. PMI_857]